MGVVQGIKGLLERVAPHPVEVDNRSHSRRVHFGQVMRHSLGRQELLARAEMVVYVDGGKRRLFHLRRFRDEHRLRRPVLEFEFADIGRRLRVGAGGRQQVNCCCSDEQMPGHDRETPCGMWEIAAARIRAGQRTVVIFPLGCACVNREGTVRPAGPKLVCIDLRPYTTTQSPERSDILDGPCRIRLGSPRYGWRLPSAGVVRGLVAFEYADKRILCGITNLLLKPAEYSQI